MRQNKRSRQVKAVAKGFLTAMLATLAGMAVLTLAVWKTDMSDSTLVLLNQILKIGSVALGTYLAVGRGGETGFITGALIGTLYIAVGYGLYAALGGPASIGSVLGEWITGAAAGALTGAIAANLPASTRKRRATASSKA